jgi:deoxyhypusine synthase
VPALQLTVLLLVVVFANDTIVKDDSYLRTARLLAPVIEKLGNSGSLLTVDEVVDLLGSKLVRL